jgi:AraC-like DNA-binding protein
MQQAEHTQFDIKPMSAYCAARRSHPHFNARCIACDRAHLAVARAQRDVHIYRCHNGLLEGVVPLYDRRNFYVGAIVFGQLREAGARPPADATAAHRRLFLRLPVSSEVRATDVGSLLKCMSEYIIGNELIRCRNRPWAERLDAYIEENLGRAIRIGDMATALGCSKSFVSHRFRAEFGLSPKQYIQRRRMDEARVLLETGDTVQRAAARLGFHDAFHFSKAFRAHWGRPPKLFKQV